MDISLRTIVLFCILIPGAGSLVRYKYTLSYRSILKVAGGQHGAVHEVIPSRQIFILFYFTE